MLTTNTSTSIKLNTIEEAIEDIRQGRIIIVVDDENRENEGDLIAAAEMVTPEMINYGDERARTYLCSAYRRTMQRIGSFHDGGEQYRTASYAIHCIY